MKTSAFALASLAFALGIASTLATGYGNYGKNYVGAGGAAAYSTGYDSSYSSGYDNLAYGNGAAGYNFGGYDQSYGYSNGGFDQSFGYSKGGYTGYGSSGKSGLGKGAVTTVRYPVPVAFPQPLPQPAVYGGAQNSGILGGLSTEERKCFNLH